MKDNQKKELERTNDKIKVLQEQLAHVEQSLHSVANNKSQYRSQIITLMDKAKDQQLKDILSIVQTMIMSGKTFDELYDRKEKIQSDRGGNVDSDCVDREISVADAMKSGQLFHIKYDPTQSNLSDDDDSNDDDNDDLSNYDIAEVY